MMRDEGERLIIEKEYDLVKDSANSQIQKIPLG